MSKHKSIVVYAVTDKAAMPAGARKAYNMIPAGDGHNILIRAEVMNCHYDDAIFKAKPKKWETVCNSHPAGQA